MAQTGYTPISLYYTTTASAVPTAGNLVNGELAININTADGKLFYKDSAGVVQVLATKDATSGSFVNLSYSGTFTGGTGVVNLGSGQFYKDASGNVSIGTNSPSCRFDVVGSANSIARFYNSGSGSTDITLNNASNATDMLLTRRSNGEGWLYMSGANPLAFYTNATERMRIDSSGNVGIGTTSISSPSGFGRFVAIGDSDTGIGQISDGILAFATNNTEKVRIDANGNFLVGTTSASYGGANRGLIEVNGSSESLIAFKIGGGTTNAVYQYNTTNNFETNVTGARYANWTVNGSERMRIDSGGNLLVGITAYATTPSSGVTIQTGFNASVNVGHNNSGSGFLFVNFGYNSGQIGSITQSGTTAVAYNTTSDYRLKENIVPLTGALAKVQALKPVTYTWKSAPDEIGEGFIAHELAEVCPQAVTGKKDAMRIEKYEISPAIPSEFDADGNVIKEAVEAVMGEREVPAYQSIDTSFLIATLTAAIQEQQVMIEELKAKVAALEAA